MEKRGQAAQASVMIPEWLDAETASDVAGPAWVLPLSVAPLNPGMRVAGVARTALAARDDNGVVRHVLARGPETGGILVVAGASVSRSAIVGDLTARELQAAGYEALVTDGPVRDAEELQRIPFPVWCGGRTALASGKEQQGHIGIPVSIGGVIITPGDIVIASAGGVVIWPEERVPEVLAAAHAKHRADTDRLTRITSLAT